MLGVIPRAEAWLPARPAVPAWSHARPGGALADALARGCRGRFTGL